MQQKVGGQLPIRVLYPKGLSLARSEETSELGELQEECHGIRDLLPSTSCCLEERGINEWEPVGLEIWILSSQNKCGRAGAWAENEVSSQSKSY